MVYLVSMGDLAKKEKEDILDQEEPLEMLKKELLAHQDNQENKGQKVWMVHLEFLGSKDFLV